MVLLYKEAKNHILHQSSHADRDTLNCLKEDFSISARPGERIHNLIDLLREREDELAVDSDSDLEDEANDEILKDLGIVANRLGIHYPRLEQALSDLQTRYLFCHMLLRNH